SSTVIQTTSSSTSAGPTQSFVTIPQVPPFNGAKSCPADDGKIFTTDGGAQFEIQCFKDTYGNNFMMQYTDNYESCLTLCANTQGCILASFVPGSPAGPCYLKDSPGVAGVNEHVMGARLIGMGGGTSTSSTRSSSSSTSMSSATTSTSTSTSSSTSTSTSVPSTTKTSTQSSTTS
ncbi:hypothetical protein K402DRAFT_316665, partial [Aulographum hederae CBS 113979]